MWVELRYNRRSVGEAKKKSGSASSRAAKSGVTLIVAVRARPGQEAALEKELRALVAPSRAERGCIAYDLHASSDQPGLFLLREIWRSLDHHKKHWEMPHMKRWAERKGALMASRESSFWKQIA
jgi:quinol monooxygenase YgiN